MKQNQPRKANLQNHPSFQSTYKFIKPSIRVNYKVIAVNKNDLNEECKKQGKKNVNKCTDFNISTSKFENSKQKISRLKLVQSSLNQYQSGKFIDQEYHHVNQKNNRMNKLTFSRARVSQSVSRYQMSKSVQKSIKGQYIHKNTPSCFISSSRVSKMKTQNDSYNGSISRNISNFSSLNSQSQSQCSQRRKLPGYSKEGIKDIMEYEHAGEYRQNKLTQKCNKSSKVKQIKDKFHAFDEIHDFDFRKKLNTLSNEVRLNKGLR